MIKKPIRDPGNLKGYRTVLNVTIISKLVEKTDDAQFYEHMEGNGLLERMLSVCRPKHSVETAFGNIQHEILLQIDQSKGVILVLLDKLCHI